MRDFIAIGENLHCSRSVRTAGPRVRGGAIVFEGGSLPVPAVIRDGAEWAGGRVRPCAVAAWQALHGDETGRQAAVAYVGRLAAAQAAAGARYLDVNVDEFSADVAACCAAMRWMASAAQAAAPAVLSVDSPRPEILEAGLAACDPARGAPLLNSVSLERPQTAALAARFGAAVVASAAGASSVPPTAAGRLANVMTLLERLAAQQIAGGRVFVDPLVLPAATDGTQPGVTLETIRAVRRACGRDVHATAGIGNVSFGLPHRRLLNEVFTWLALEAGADSGIVDPVLSGPARIAALDPGSEPFRLAAALLRGEDEYGAAFLAASREGRLGAAR